MHLRTWKCSFGCKESFSSRYAIRDHFAERHGFGENDTRVLALSIRPERESPEKLLCPLCGDEFSFYKRYNRHVAEHLEQVALFALPRDSVENENEDEDEDEDENYEDRIFESSADPRSGG